MEPKILSTSPLFATRWLSLYSRKAEIRGREIDWTFASRSKDPKPGLQESPAAVQIVAMVEQDGEPAVVCTSEFRVPIGVREISFPAGLVEPGEPVIQAAERELFEETGLKIKKVECVSPVNLCSSAGFADEMTQIVFCEAEGVPTNANAEGMEDIEIMVVKWKDIPALIGRTDVAFSAKAWCILWGLQCLTGLATFLGKDNDSRSG